MGFELFIVKNSRLLIKNRNIIKKLVFNILFKILLIYIKKNISNIRNSYKISVKLLFYFHIY